MPNNASVKKSLQLNKKAFSELDDSLFVEIELGEEEKASGGGVGTSPSPKKIWLTPNKALINGL